LLALIAGGCFFYFERRPIVETAHRQTLCAAEAFPASSDPPANQSISVYRVSLVKDESVSFGNVRLANSQEAQALIQNLILTKGQPDREQFVVALLNAKNEMIGLNIVSVGALSSAPVHPREVLKPAFWPMLQQ
jgi:DNA repair protein RadC